MNQKTKNFALRIIRMYCVRPKSTEAQVPDRQILKSGTSVEAHYREAMRARSDAEFMSKLEGGMQELEETKCQLELLAESDIISPAKYSRAFLRTETDDNDLTCFII